MGVDEWAWRKGYSGYGTILVDLQRGIVSDLLPDRSAAAFEKWLREHPEVRIISRDPDSVYADGGYSGAPQAEQVADRFHLVQNLTKAVQTELEHRRDHLLIPATEFMRKEAIGGPVPSQPLWARPNPRQKEIKRQRRQQKEELFAMVKGMQAQGMRAFEIVKATGISRGVWTNSYAWQNARSRTRWRHDLAWRKRSGKSFGGCGIKGARTEGNY